MNKFKNNSKIITLLVFILLMLFLNIFFSVYPVLNFLKYLESKNHYWLVLTGTVILFGIWSFIRRNINKKIMEERVKIFSATIRTIQDVLQNSASSMQLLILDMKEERVHDEIIMKAEKNIEELKTAINVLASIDPAAIDLKELNKSMSIIKIYKSQ